MSPFPKYTGNIYVGKQTVQKQEEYLCINIKTFNISIYPLYTVVKSTKVIPQYKTTPLTQRTDSNIHSCPTRPPGGALVAELHFGEYDGEK